MVKRLSRKSPFDFNQTQMPAIRNQMIEQIVACVIPISTPLQVISPPRSDVENIVQRPGQFDMPASERIKRLENELRKLKAQFATHESEFNQFRENANQQLDAIISAIRNETEVEIQKLKSELVEAHYRVEIMAATSEQTQSEQLQYGLFRSEVATQKGEVTMPEASTQTEQPTLDSPQPMFDEYLDNFDKPCTNPKPLIRRALEISSRMYCLHQTIPKMACAVDFLSMTRIMMSRLLAANGLILRHQSIAHRIHLMAPQHHPFLNMNPQSKLRNLQ